MDADTLDADFYRERARSCHKLAEAATAARPLFVRLFFLAKACEERATAADVVRVKSSKAKPPNGPKSFASQVDGKAGLGGWAGRHEAQA
jgi:hypothetical protein